MVTGNNPEWLRPHLPNLLHRIRNARAAAGFKGPEKITITCPNCEDVSYSIDGWDETKRVAKKSVEKSREDSPAPKRREATAYAVGLLLKNNEKRRTDEELCRMVMEKFPDARQFDFDGPSGSRNIYWLRLRLNKGSLPGYKRAKPAIKRWWKDSRGRRVDEKP